MKVFKNNCVDVWDWINITVQTDLTYIVNS